MPRRLPALLLAISSATRAEGPVIPATDPVLEGLTRDALAKSPDYARARADLGAEQQLIPQAGALPDPTLALGIQNDGFHSIKIGVAETSFWQVVVTQPLPWPGKRTRREEAARAQVGAVEARVDRIRLTVTADVERTYVDLLLVHDRLDLLARLENLWRQAEATVRSRYEVGATPQSDLLRVQLERTRLRQDRIALEVEKRTAIQALNRLRAHPLDELIPTWRRLTAVPTPALLSVDEALTDAERRSPDLALARRAAIAADRRVAAAQRDRWPDLSVSAGVMPRGGIEPMWLASVGITLPVFSKKGSAVAESEGRRDGEQQGEEAMRQVVALRARERQAALDSALRTLQLYREGLLIQSNAAVQSTLSQYRVGKVPFISVLEVMRGFLADEDGYLKALADAQRIGIAIREVSLDAPPGLGTAGGITASSVPGPSESGAASGTRRVASAAGGAAQPGAATSSGAM